jgi:hypothetical protein
MLTIAYDLSRVTLESSESIYKSASALDDLIHHSQSRVLP